MKPSRNFVAGITLSVISVLAIAVPASAQSWTQLSPSGGPPPQRFQHTAVYDRGTNVMMIFGGENFAGGAGGPCVGTTCLNDVWTLSNADGQGGTPNWTKLVPSGGAPLPRFGPTAVYDQGSNRMIVYGGGSNKTPPYFGGCTGQFNDVWVLSNANGSGGTPAWTQLSVAGGPPIARQHHTAAYDANSNRMIVFAGNGLCGVLADVWVLTEANGLGGTPTWMQLSPAGPAPSNRAGHAAAYDEQNNRFLVFGGNGCPTVVPPGPGQCSMVAFDQVWVLENANGLGGAPVWTQLATAGGPPSPRGSATAVYNPAANSMIILGGGDIAGNILSDAWLLSNANGLGGTPTWTQLSTAGGPGARVEHTAIYDATTDRMTVFAGLQVPPLSAPLNDVWVLANANGVPNQPPVADAGADQTVECNSHTGTSVTLDGSASSDPDAGDTLSYEWRDAGNNIIGTSAAATVSVPLGTHTFTLTVSDGNGGSASDSVQVVVQDTTPPTLTLSSTTETIVVPTASSSGVAVDVLAASGAAANDVCDPSPSLSHNGPAVFPLGTTIVTITATDDSGNYSQKTFTVQVVYNFIGFLMPIRNDGSSIFRSGRAVPVKFQLTAADGSFISNATATLQVFQVTDQVLGTVEEVTPDASGSSNTGNLFRYDSTSNQYIYDLSTKGYASGTYLLRAVLNDGTTHEVQVSVR